MVMKPMVKIFIYSLLSVAAVVWLLPVLWVVISSLKTNSDLYSFLPSYGRSQSPSSISRRHSVKAILACIL